MHEVAQPLENGTWYFHLRTRDGALNWSEPAHLGPFRLDRNPPSRPALSSRSHFVLAPSSDRTVDVELAASDDASGVDGFSYAWDHFPGAEADTVKELEESASGVTSPALADGDWWVHVRTVDNAGTWSENSTMGPFRIDTLPPETMLDSGPGALTSDATPTFTFRADEPGSFECRLDEGSFTACASPHTTGLLAEGAHTFLVRAVDLAGNVDASPQARPFAVDTTPPETTIDAGPGATTNDRTPTFTFSAREPAAGFECRLDGASFAPCSSPYTTAPLPDGAHSFEVRATDLVGNVEPTPARHPFRVTTRVRRAAVALASRTVAVTAGGVAPIKLACGSQTSCAGRITLEASVDVRLLSSQVRAEKRRKVKLGSRPFTLRAGRTAAVRVRLTRRGFRLVTRTGRLRTRAFVVIRQSGGGKTTTARTITLTARKR